MCIPGTFHALHQEPEDTPTHSDRLAERVSRRAALVGGAVAAAFVAATAVPAQAAHRRHGAVRDLIHVFRAGFPSYAGDPPGRRTVATIEDTDFYVVCMYSGWERRVPDSAAYRNPGPDGRLHFPGFGLEAVEWLLEERGIVALGVDTLSLDAGASTTFPVHKRLLGADRYGLENLANLGQIPPRGAEAVVGIVPWEEGSGGPCRVLARW